MKCNICPRNCGKDRKREYGFCGCGDEIIISKYMLHHWEEPIISGDINSAGSGAIFFAGCNLKCVYCQNYEISNHSVGKTLSTPDFVKIMKELEERGALNINLVTPTHYTLQIIDALKIYKPKVPIVWNSSGYENAEIIKILKDLVDIYLVDLKYMDSSLAGELSLAKDYPEIATKTILQMKKNQPNDILENGIMKKGVIIRHLVLPNCIDNSFKCLEWIEKNLGKQQFVSLMSQYVPCFKAKEISKINRKLHPIEYKRVLNKMEELGFENGFCQELSSADKIYTPDFSTFND